MSTSFDDTFLAQQDSIAVPTSPATRDVRSQMRMSASRLPSAVKSVVLSNAASNVALRDATGEVAVNTAADSLAASAVTPLVQAGKPFENLPEGSFAQADPMDAGEMLLLITTNVNPDGTLSLRGDMRQAMRQEMRQWVENIRRRGGPAATELRSPTPRDEAIDALCSRVLGQASKAKAKLWSAALPTGRQIALVSQEVFDSIGVESLVQKLHHKAIQVAMEQGDPFNDKALAMYEAPTPNLMGGR